MSFVITSNLPGAVIRNTPLKSLSLIHISSSGSFVYNTTTDEFTSFVVDWDGAVYNMTTEANAPASAGLAPGDPCITASGAAATFQAFTTCDSAGGGLEWNALGNSGVEGLFEFFYKNAGGFGVPIFSLDTGDYVDPTAAVGLRCV